MCILSYRVLLNSWLRNTDWFCIKLSDELVNSLRAYIFEIHLGKKFTASKTRISKVPIIYETVIFAAEAPTFLNNFKSYDSCL